MSAAPLAEAPEAPPETPLEEETPAEGTPEAQEETVTLNLTLFEGYRPVKATLNFGGNIEIRNPDVAQALKLGREVTLVVRGEVRSRGHKKTGEGKDAAASSTVVVSSVELHED